VSARAFGAEKILECFQPITGFTVRVFSILLGVEVEGAAMDDHPAPLKSLNFAEAAPTQKFEALDHFVTSGGMKVSYYALSLEQVPADFFADPDGAWSYEVLARAAGFASHSGVAIGALKCAFNGHPDGAAVVTLNALTRPYVAIIECPIAYGYVQRVDEDEAASSAA
jgi:hypothetical protein